MANKRVFQASAVKNGTQGIGGVAQIGLDFSYKDILRSPAQGAVGIEDLETAGLRVGVNLDCGDVLLALALMNLTPSGLQWYGKEAGAATFHKYEILAADAVIVWHGLNLKFSANADAQLSLNGTLRFASGTKDFADVLKVSDVIAASTRATDVVYPLRMYRLGMMSFDPDAVGPTTFSPLHFKSLNVSLKGRVLEDYDDDDIGLTSVDVADWGPVEASIEHLDASKQTGTNPQADMVAKLRTSGAGTLTTVIKGVAGAANKTFTMRNLKFIGASPSFGADYARFSMKAESTWRNNVPTTPVIYSLDGVSPTVKIFEFA